MISFRGMFLVKYYRPLRSHPTAHAWGPHDTRLRRGLDVCAAGTPRRRGRESVDDGWLRLVSPERQTNHERTQ